MIYGEIENVDQEIKLVIHKQINSEQSSQLCMLNGKIMK